MPHVLPVLQDLKQIVQHVVAINILILIQFKKHAQLYVLLDIIYLVLVVLLVKPHVHHAQEILILIVKVVVAQDIWIHLPKNVQLHVHQGIMEQIIFANHVILLVLHVQQELALIVHLVPVTLCLIIIL